MSLDKCVFKREEQHQNELSKSGPLSQEQDGRQSLMDMSADEQ